MCDAARTEERGKKGKGERKGLRTSTAKFRSAIAWLVKF